MTFDSVSSHIVYCGLLLENQFFIYLKQKFLQKRQRELKQNNWYFALKTT